MRRIGTGVTGRPILGRLFAIDDRVRAINENEDIILEPNGTGEVKSTSNVEIQDGNSLQLNEPNNIYNITVTAPNDLSQDITLTLPSAVNSGNVLTTDANGNLSWSDLTIEIDDVSTQSATFYPVMTESTTGSVSSFEVSQQTMTFQPNNGILTVGELRSEGDVTAYFSSDIALKDNIENISNAIEKVSNLNGVEYDWTDTYLDSKGGEDGYYVRKHDIGLIAQDVEKVLPDIVATNKNGYKAIKYDRVVALLVEAIKEQKQEIDNLKNTMVMRGNNNAS